MKFIVFIFTLHTVHNQSTPRALPAKVISDRGRLHLMANQTAGQGFMQSMKSNAASRSLLCIKQVVHIAYKTVSSYD